jgi:predicted acyl esterase
MRTIPAFAVLFCVGLLLSGCVSAPSHVARQPARVGAHAQIGSEAVPKGLYKFDGQFSQVLAEGPLKELPFVKNFVKSKLDGVDIEIGYWRPDVPEGTKVPIIIDAGPYYGNDGAPMEKKGGRTLFMTNNFVSHGYAVAAIAVRGTGGSGGCMDLMGPKEISDLSQAVTWLAEQPWSNGNVGMYGKSYDGSTPWMVAASGNPHLKTIVPVSGVPDVYELMFRNGSAEIRGSFVLNALYYSYAVRNNYAPPATPDEAIRYATHTAQGLACPDHVVGLEASMFSGTVGSRDPTGFWAERNNKVKALKNYKGSVLMVQGLQDWNVDPGLNLPFGDQLNQTGLPVHYMLGQWGHEYPDQRPTQANNPNMRWDWAQIMLNWMDYYLKALKTVDLGPVAQVLDNTGRWHVDSAWPPRDANWATLHLGSGQALTPQPGASGSALLTPQLVSPFVTEGLKAAPGRSADFYLPPAQKDMLISGLPRVHVTVTPTGPTGHLAAWLYSVDAAGKETRLGWTMMNLNFADGTETFKPLTPNQPVLAKMEIQPMDALVKVGDKLLLRIWQYRDDPGYAGAAPDVQGRLPPVVPEPVTLNWGGSVHSTLELPMIERGPEAYFTPPHPS